MDHFPQLFWFAGGYQYLCNRPAVISIQAALALFKSRWTNLAAHSKGCKRRVASGSPVIRLAVRDSYWLSSFIQHWWIDWWINILERFVQAVNGPQKKCLFTGSFAQRQRGTCIHPVKTSVCACVFSEAKMCSLYTAYEEIFQLIVIILITIPSSHGCTVQ